VPVLHTQTPLTRVRVATQAVQLEGATEQFRHEYTQALQVDDPASYVPVLHTQTPLTRVLPATQAVQFVDTVEQLRHEYTQALQVDTPES
jgi:hypothetical protein